MTTTQLAEDLLASPPHRGHLVQLYEDKEGLARAVARFVAEGVRKDESVIVIATGSHREAFARALHEEGVDLARCTDTRQVMILDAEETLGKFMADGAANRSKFDAVIGGVLEELKSRGLGRRIRAYGEMVDLLWRAGRLDAALQLEALWSDLLKRESFVLLCGYRMSLLGPELDENAFRDACGAHSHTVLAQDRERLEAAVDLAMERVLGMDSAAALRPLIAANMAPRRPLGRAEHTILWVRRNLPAKSEEILAQARRCYEEGSAP